MKKIFMYILLMSLSSASFSQELNPTPVLTKQDLLKKSKGQRTAGIILAGTGGAMSMAGILLAIEGTAEEIGGAFFGETNVSKKDNSGAVLLIAGLATMTSSIPLFIASNKNKRKAMSMGFKNIRTPLTEKNSFVYRSIPSLNIKISL